ncbi:GNAT family N-acetyltransferase [Aestuariivivens insulae]|uniref:GNAT family N-acetyltransferase n=1 Tax=Aestuariivivens insulae TaxID=1621988 RepID=UPI001F57349E|nr:GNAT family N-acetyltransferase [Aestuariivivens insulae]
MEKSNVSNDYKVVKYSEVYYHQWNSFVFQAKNATFLFHRDFMEYHSDRFEDFSLMIFKKEVLIAVLPANVSGLTVYSHQGLTYGGLVLKKDIKFNDALNIFSAILEYLSRKSYKKLEIKCLPSIYSSVPNNEIDYIMFLLEGILIKRDTLSVINQKETIKMSRNRIEGYKRGVKHDLKIVEETNFDAFWNMILIPNLKAKYNALPVHSLDEIILLRSRFPNNIRQFNVYHRGEIVAGTTIFETKNVAHCQYISGNSDSNQLGSLDFLFGHLIKNVFADKAYFDFGSSNENNGKYINSGLQYWKEGFGARTITQDFYSVSIANYKNLNAVLP